MPPRTGYGDRMTQQMDERDLRIVGEAPAIIPGSPAGTGEAKDSSIGQLDESLPTWAGICLSSNKPRTALASALYFW
jgi:hypothetical protein